MPAAPAVDVNELTFGIELETILPRGACRVSGYHNGIQIAGQPEGWTAESDSSVRGMRTNEMPAEIVSPKLKGVEGLQKVKAVLAWLNAAGARVNSSTGFHVHIGWKGEQVHLARLVTATSFYEKALFALTGTHSRENGHYTGSVRDDNSYAERFKGNKDNGVNSGGYWDRFRVLNLMNLGECRKNTVEFRVFAGTTNPTKVLGSIRLCLALVEDAMSGHRAFKWTGKSACELSYYQPGCDGQTEVRRMLNGLGLGSTVGHVYGSIEADGLPTLKDAKVLFLTMARKYDVAPALGAANAADASDATTRAAPALGVMGRRHVHGLGTDAAPGPAGPASPPRRSERDGHVPETLSGDHSGRDRCRNRDPRVERDPQLCDRRLPHPPICQRLNRSHQIPGPGTAPEPTEKRPMRRPPRPPGIYATVLQIHRAYERRYGEPLSGDLPFSEGAARLVDDMGFHAARDFIALQSNDPAAPDPVV